MVTPFSCFLVGNEHLAVECGTRLIEAGHRIVAVVTERDEIANWAAEQDLDVFDGLPALAEGEEQVDWLFSIANLRMIPDTVLRRARKGGINFHDGPLPRYAGLNAPVWAIAAGETNHGITWHLMEKGADKGDIIVQRTFQIASDETAFTLNAKCFAAGIESFEEVLNQIESGLPDRRPQDVSERTYFGRSHAPYAAGRVDLSEPTETILRRVRALDHSGYDNPVGSSWIATEGPPLLISGAEAVEGSGEPGEVLSRDEAEITVATGDSAIRFTGLRDTMGAASPANSLPQVGVRLPILTPQECEALEERFSALAGVEAKWRARFDGYRPARIFGLSTPADEPTPVRATFDRHGADDGLVMSAFAALASLMSDGDAVDLALGLEGSSPLDSGWGPVRFSPETSLGEARAAFDAVLRSAADIGGFAFDLPARIASLAERDFPLAAIHGQETPIGSALTLVPENDLLISDGTSVSQADAERMAARLSHVLSQAGTLAPETRIDDLPILPDSERDLLVESFNRTAVDIPSGLTMHRSFEAQAEASPQAEALVFEDDSLTYADLNARANRLAHVLIGMGIRPGTPVGLHMTRGPGLIVGAMAILKAGGAYVPLDPGYPADRIAFYAADSKAPVIVSESALPGDLVPEGSERLLADTDERLVDAPDTNPEVAVSDEDLAYLIYTSGSTGTPKGVMIEHRNAINFFTGMDARIDHQAGDVFLSVTSLSFDISVLEIFWTLSRGFKVVLLGEEKLVAGDGQSARVPGGMDFSFFYWGNDDGVGRDKYGLLLEGAKFADENGFQAVWTPERHFHAFGGLYPNPSVTGAAVAAVTRNIAVRAGSCVAPLHHPARIAEEWAVIDNLTNGKTGLAIASGWHPDDFVLRAENAPPRNKEAVFESIRDLRQLWSGKPLAMTRADGTVVEKLTQPRPVSDTLEMWLTIAGNPDAWRQAGEEGVHVLTHLLGQTIDEVETKIGIYHDALRASGRDPKDYKVTLMLHTYLADTRERSMEVAREPMKAYLKAAADLIKQYAWAFPAFKRPAGVETPRDLNLGGLSEDEMDDILEFAFLRYFETSGLFGTVEEALERVSHLKSIGVTEVACLVDYGIERQTILDGLTRVAEVRARSNIVAEADDFSIAAQIARHDVTHLQCTPYMARMLVENDDSKAALSRLRHLLIGGEALPAALVSDLRKATKADIQNMYGPTETTIWSSTGPVSEADAIVSVGTPIANTQLYVLDDAMQPVAIGQVGQLWIGGAGVARGYWERLELTAEKFVANPFHGGRMFGTGDQARWRPDGSLDFLGRRDNQIKIRGYRIEIGEIEAAMEAVDGVTQAVAIVRQDATGVGQIYGYLTGSATEAGVRSALSEKLPAFMVPTRIVTLERFPLTPNRKIDRKALPDPSRPKAAPAPAATPVRPAAQSDAPGEGVEVSMDQVAAIWSRVLSVSSVAPSDNFFDLGGHSLLAIEVHRAIKTELGVTGVSIADIFRAPTLRGLVEVISKNAKSAPRARRAAPVEERESVPPATVSAPPPEVSDETLVSRRRALRSNKASAG